MPLAPVAQAPAAYNPQQLQQLWVSNGGNPKAAPMAAAIAMAESSGRPGAINHNSNGSIDRGTWQINSVHGPLSTFNPVQNVKAAIAISKNGADWSPWTTFTSGAYKQYLGSSGTLPAVKTAAPTLAALPVGASSARAKVVDNVLSNTLGAGLSTTAKNLLFSDAQANMLHAHNDLQNLSGTTDLNVHPFTGEGGSRLTAMLKQASSLVGKPYVWGGGHSGFGPQQGYDCSGFVSAVLHAGGFLNAPQTTQTLPSQPSIASGPGRFVTVYDRTDGGSPNQDHVIIDLNGAWYESGGNQPGVARIPTPSQQYLSEFNRQLHPLGL